MKRFDMFFKIGKGGPFAVDCESNDIVSNFLPNELRFFIYKKGSY